MNITFFRQNSFSWLLALKAFVALLLLLLFCPPLLPDEAQYWLWSQHLDIGYYSKPPAIAWVIALSYSILGHCEVAVRFPSLLMSNLAAWYLAKTMKSLGASDAASRLSTWLFVFSPIVLYGSFAATTDVGLLLGWCAVCYYLEQPMALYRHRWAIVFWSMWALLFKPSILVLGLASFFRFWDPERRLKAGYIFLGCVLGGVFPFLWNLEHDFVTVRHIFTQLLGPGQDREVASFWQTIHFKRPLDLILAQVLLFSPWVSFKIAQRVKAVIKEPLTPVKWHATLALVILGFTLLGSFKVKFQANWPLIAFPSFFCLLSFAQLSKKWVRGHVVAHSALFLMALTLFYGQDKGWPVLSQSPKNLNLFRSVEGWQVIKDKMPHLPWKQDEGFWISDRYQSCSLLAFYGPSQEVYWFNLHGARQNQFSFWPVASCYLGSPARFVLVDACSEQEMEAQAPLSIEKIKPYFQKVLQVTVVPLWTYRGKVEKCALIIDLEGYLGSRPKDPKSF